MGYHILINRVVGRRVLSRKMALLIFVCSLCYALVMPLLAHAQTCYVWDVWRQQNIPQACPPPLGQQPQQEIQQEVVAQPQANQNADGRDQWGFTPEDHERWEKANAGTGYFKQNESGSYDYVAPHTYQPPCFGCGRHRIHNPEQ